MRNSELIKVASKIGKILQKSFAKVPHTSRTIGFGKADGDYVYRSFTLPDTPHGMSHGTMGGLSSYIPDASNSIHIVSSSIPKYVRKMGLGQKMYGNEIRRRFLDYKNNQGRRFITSDDTGLTSEAAQNMWRGLTAKGYQVRESPLPKSPMFSIDLHDMRSFYKDR